MKFNVGFKTDIGMKRQQNQDSGLASPELGLFIVADGMGGHRGGEIASQMVAEIIPETVKRLMTEKKIPAGETLKLSLLEANQKVFKRSKNEPKLTGMGTTVTALFFYEGKLYVGQVGDSRCYFIRPGAIWQITKDHSLVQEKLRAGLITRDQLRNDQMKNVITRSIGFENHVVVDLFEQAVQPGDLFLVCSDGLTGQLEDKDILEIANQAVFDASDIKSAVEQLVQKANARGGDDNITSLMIQVVAN